MVLKTSVVSMTSTEMITSLALMTSTASLASKSQKLLTPYLLSDFPGIRNLSSLNDLNSLNNQWPQWPQQPLFIKNFTELDVFINPSTKTTYPGLSIWEGSSNTNYFTDFWHSFCWRLSRPWRLPFFQINGYKSNVHCQWTYRYLFHSLELNFKWSSKTFISCNSIRKTLYIPNICSIWHFDCSNVLDLTGTSSNKLKSILL